MASKPISTVLGKTFPAKDTTNTLKSDTLAADTTQKKPQRDIETTIDYTAEDSIVIDAQTKQAFLYRDAKVEYGKMKMTAHTIDMDYNTNIVNAAYGRDSLDNKIGIPIFNEGSDAYEAGGIKYNYKSKRGQVKQIVTKQGDGVIRGTVVKKEPNNTMYVDGASYSTCDLREPHFCIKMLQIKVIPKKKIVTRAFNLQLDDIPTPIAFPFGVFPIPKRRGSGLIFPSPGESQQRGFFVSNLGFFWAVNDYIGLTFLTDQYSVGGLGTGRYNTVLDYKSRYSFSGKFSATFSNLKDNPDDPIKRVNTEQIWINWSHVPITKGTGKFSASVNAGSGNFNRNNSFNAQTRQTGNFSSTLSYSNVIKKTPFSYAISGRQDQNIATGVMNFVLPEASLNMNRIYPLKEIPVINKVDWVKKLQFSYRTNFTNRVANILSNTTAATRGYELSNAISVNKLNPNSVDYLSEPGNYSADTARINKFYRADTVQTERFFREFTQNSRWNMTHSIPVSTTFKLFKYFNFTPNFNYTETWYQSKYSFSSADTNSTRGTAINSVKVDTLNSFEGGNLARKYDMNGGISATTRIYGTFYIKKLGIEAIRHTLIPTIGYTYKPNFVKETYQRIDTVQGKIPIYIDKFTGLRVADPSNVKDASESISFGLANTFEAKVVDKKDTSKTEKKFKKLMLIDNLSISNNYNLRADSFNLGNFQISARTKLFGLLDINFSTIFNPYRFESMGVDTFTGYEKFKHTKSLAWNNVDKQDDEKLNFKWDDKQGLGHFVSANLAVSTRFTGKKKGNKIDQLTNGTDRQFMYNSFAPGYVDFTLPWTLSLNFNMLYNRYSGTPSPNSTFTDKSSFRNNLAISGDFTVTAKWKLGYTTGYDFNPLPGRDNISTTQLNISRDLHCWYATFSTALYPATFQYFLFTIGIKAPALSDVKFPRRSTPFRDN
ncbi:MAG: putative LPS assembly protein LptD [Cytophagales bacterium]